MLNNNDGPNCACVVQHHGSKITTPMLISSRYEVHMKKKNPTFPFFFLLKVDLDLLPEPTMSSNLLG